MSTRRLPYMWLLPGRLLEKYGLLLCSIASEIFWSVLLLCWCLDARLAASHTLIGACPRRLYLPA